MVRSLRRTTPAPTGKDYYKHMIFNFLQIIVAASLIGVILLQAQGGGISPVFGGGGEFYRSKQNIEKILIFLTIALSSLLAVFSIVLLTLR